IAVPRRMDVAAPTTASGAKQSMPSASSDHASRYPSRSASRARSACSAKVKPSSGTESARRFTRSRSPRARPGSRTRVDPAVLVPGQHDLLDVLARLVERDLLDERLDVVAAPRGQPLAHASGTGVVGRQRQPRIVELAHQPGQEARAELDVEP